MDIRRNMKQLYSFRGSTVVIVTVGGIVVALLIFHAGVAYGERHAFGRMHGLGRGAPPEFGMFTHSFIPQGHGAVGTITAVSSSTLTLQTRDGEVETVEVNVDTVVHGTKPGDMHFADLTVGQDI